MNESGNVFENENEISDRAKIKVVVAIIFPKPSVLFRDAKYKAALNAPNPTAEFKYPKVVASPFNIFFAKTGRRTIYGFPNKLTAANNNITDLIGRNPKE